MSDGDSPTDVELALLLSSQRRVEAAQQRSRQRWLRQQALEEAQLSGVLLGLAEQHVEICLRTSAGTSHAGAVAFVGADFVRLATTGGAVLVSTASIAVVVPDAAVRALPAGDARPAPRCTTLHQALTDEAAAHPDVVITVAPGASISGRLVAAGRDVATVEVGVQRALCYVSLPSVADVCLRASG